MLPAVAVILFCQLAGEAVVRAAGLPLPGPVLGMALLFLLLVARDQLAARGARRLGGNAIENVGRVLLANLSLLFVPAGVGVVQRLDVLARYGLPLIVALVVSTVAALLVAVGVFRLLARRFSERMEPEAGGEGL
ncbi:MAG TPA: CidA/LrgA family protein [Dongiaceae bacterium]|nr:CidA/LrgA family protein [Dongiaceae bacterium]